jgi:hypothetical protein
MGSKPKPTKNGPKGGRKHTPGRDHTRKSGAAKKRRFAKKKQRQREDEQEQCRDQWEIWDSLSEDAKKLRPDLYPDCPRPTDANEDKENSN